MTSDENKAVVLHLIDDGIDRGDDSAVDDTVAPNFVTGEGDATQEIGIEAFKGMLAAYRGAFPDGRLHVEEVLAEGDKVITWGVFTGTHLGTFEGIPPTGKEVRVKDVDLYRLENGKIVEMRANMDQMGMMQQLGLLGAGEEH